MVTMVTVRIFWDITGDEEGWAYRAFDESGEESSGAIDPIDRKSSADPTFDMDATDEQLIEALKYWTGMDEIGEVEVVR